MSKFKSFTILFGALLSVLGSTTPALAANVTCAVTNVSWNSSDKQMGVYCGGTWYISNLNAHIDTKKIWVSMAQAALLAGRTMEIASDANGIYWMKMN